MLIKQAMVVQLVCVKLWLEAQYHWDENGPSWPAWWRWIIFDPISRFQVGFLLNMASPHFGCFLPPKPPIFGPTWTWNDTWRGHKSAQNIFPHCWGCVLAHYPVSGWVMGLPYQPNNPPGNWIMGQNTPQAMGIDVLDTFMHHPGVIPGPGGSENGWFWG